jgi:hypothetical protein
MLPQGSPTVLLLECHFWGNGVAAISSESIVYVAEVCPISQPCVTLLRIALKLLLMCTIFAFRDLLRLKWVAPKVLESTRCERIWARNARILLWQLLLRSLREQTYWKSCWPLQIAACWFYTKQNRKTFAKTKNSVRALVLPSLK